MGREEDPEKHRDEDYIISSLVSLEHKELKSDRLQTWTENRGGT